MDKQNLEELAKKHESDLTKQEKRLLEREKLKSMTWKERFAYIWEYYKLWFVVLVGIVILIKVGVEIYQNLQQVELLSIAVADTTENADAGKERLNADLLEKIGTGDSHEILTIDVNVSSEDDYTAVIKRSVVMASGTADILICGEELYESYGGQDAFYSWEELLGEDYEKYSSCITDGMLDISKSEVWKSYDLTDYEPVYLGVIVTSEKTENARKLVEFLFE